MLNAMMDSLPSELQQEIAQLNLVIINAGLANILEVTPTLEEEIRIAQAEDKILQVYIKNLHEGKTQDFSRYAMGTLRFRGRICVPELAHLRKKNLAEAHESSYSIHPGGTKNVRRPLTDILVGWNEKGHRLFCRLLRYM